MPYHRKPIQINSHGKQIVNRRLNPHYREGMSVEEMDRFLEMESIKVIASEKRGGEFFWYFKVSPFLDIQGDDGGQRLIGKRNPAGLRSRYAFIRQPQEGDERIYIVPTPVLQDILLDLYQEKLEAGGSRRRVDPESTYMALYPSHIDNFLVD
ncbi:MAG: hypothetical protein SA339_03040 [Methanomassiliicoccus sp.]|nr:hypothetical protein [Methanomassiliicoccus sp.]